MRKEKQVIVGARDAGMKRYNQTNITPELST